MDAERPLWDAERPGLHSHAERGNDQCQVAGGGLLRQPPTINIPRSATHLATGFAA